MTIEEMKAKGFKRYSAFIKKLIYTNEVEVWAKDLDDAEKNT
nr:MAG TPA: RNA polymerase inhibitor [Caudoviricetes sp.]